MQRTSLLAFAALAASLITGVAEAASDATSLPFRFRLNNDYSTSAGAFDADGTLVRTLWSNRRYEAGVHDAAWDGRDDDGRPVPAGADYEIRVLTHNVIYTWDGVIGNTSPDTTSPFHHDGQQFFEDLVVAGDRAFFSTKVEGARTAMRYFRLDEPQSWRTLPALPMSYFASIGLIATDSERVYWAHDSSGWSHTWGKGGDQAFVMATDRDLSREIVFESGRATCVQRMPQGCYRDAEMDWNFRSAIDVVAEVPEDPKTPILEGSRNNVTGLAVQRDGPLLFVAHGALSPARIHVLDKRSGRELGRVQLPGVGRLISVPGRDELWAIHDGAKGRVVSRVTIGPAPGFDLKIASTLQGVESPLAIALTPDGSQIAVAEGGNRQQVRAFDTASGALVWELGEPGGYAVNGPAVKPAKFSFRRQLTDQSTGQRAEHAMISFAADGSLWVADTGLSRILRFGADRQYRDQIAFMPLIYSMVLDRNDPTRLFAGYMEYTVDYDQPTNRSWRLTRYFGDSPLLTPGQSVFAGGFIDVATLTNGRTYGLIRGTNYAVEVVEVPANGDLKRFSLPLRQPVFLNKRGGLYAVRPGSGGRAEFWQRPLEGFDGDGAPSWGHEESVARVPRTARDPRANATQNTLERSVAELDPNLRVMFDTGNSDPGQFHLAAVDEGGKSWRWRASPANGDFDFANPDGVFDSSRPWYAGMQVTALGNQIVYNYHGEGWHGVGQANQFLHWYRDGLFVGQFGVPALRALPQSTPGMSGNALSIQLVEADGATYLWNNDEHAHAGVHRWHLDGVDRIREMVGRGRFGQQIDLASATAAIPHDAQTPSGLAARVAAGGVNLAWKLPSGDMRAVEVQRLQQTYVGDRFERIAMLEGNVTSFLDTEPRNGEPTVYRVRSVFSDGTSDYSNHVHFTAPVNEVMLESQNFETTPKDLRDEFHTTPTAGFDSGLIADPANPRNHVLRIRAQRPPGTKGEFRGRVRWTASPQLFKALNESMGRARGSHPDVYRIRLSLRVLQAHVSPGSDVSLQVDAGYDIFSTPGRRHQLIPAGESQQVSFTFAALPNGAGAGGLQQYRSIGPTTVVVAFPIDLRGDGDVVEYLVDDLSVSRLDPPARTTQ